MKKPGTFIEFADAIRKEIVSPEGGVVAVLCKDEAFEDGTVISITNVTQIPEEMSAENKTEIERIFLSAVTKVIIFVGNFSVVEKYKFDVICAATSAGSISEIPAAVMGCVTQAMNSGNYCLGVVSAASISDENIVNWTSDVEIGGEVVEAAAYAPRIAGIIAAKGLNGSLTFERLGEVEGCNMLSEEEIETKLNAGECFAINEDGEVVIARGITSTTEQTSQFCKIRAVVQRNFLHNTLRKRGRSLLGKLGNGFDGKMNLIGDFTQILTTFVDAGAIEEDFTCELDLEAIAVYLGSAADGLSAQEIAMANTGDKVFVRIIVKLVDVMEEIYIKVSL